MSNTRGTETCLFHRIVGCPDFNGLFHLIRVPPMDDFSVSGVLTHWGIFILSCEFHYKVSSYNSL